MIRLLLRPYKECFNFSGRSRRKEFWLFTILSVMIFSVIFFVTFFVISMFLHVTSVPHSLNLSYILLGITALLAFIMYTITCLSLMFRRLHDVNMSGIWAILSIIATIINSTFFDYLDKGVIFIIIYVISIILNIYISVILLFFNSNPGSNKYGSNPKEA